MVEIMADQRVAKIRQQLEEDLRLAEIKARDLAEQLTVQMNRRSHTEHLLQDAEDTNRKQAKRLADTVQNEHDLEVTRSTLKSLEALLQGARHTIEEREDAIAALRADCLQLQQDLRRREQQSAAAEGEAKLLHERLAQSFSTLDAVESKIARGEAETQRVVIERDANAANVTYLKDRHASLEAQTAQLVTRNVALEEALEALKADAAHSASVVAAKTFDAASVSEDLRAAHARLLEAQKTEDARREQLVQLEADLETERRLSASLNRVKAEMTETLADNDKLNTQLSQLRLSEEQLMIRTDELTALQAKHKAFELQTRAMHGEAETTVAGLRGKLTESTLLKDSIQVQLDAQKSDMSAARKHLMKIIQERSDVAAFAANESLPLSNALEMLDHLLAQATHELIAHKELSRQVPGLRKDVEERGTLGDQVAREVAALSSSLDGALAEVQRLAQQTESLRSSLDDAQRGFALKDKEGAEAHTTVQVLHSQLEEQRAQGEAVAARLSRREEEALALAAAAAADQQLLTLRQAELADAASQLMLQGEKLRETERLYGMCQEELDHKQRSDAQLRQQLEAQERAKSEAESRVGELGSHVSQLEHSLAEAEGIIQAAGDAHETACHEIASLRAELSERQQSLVEKKKQLAACEVAAAEYEDRIQWAVLEKQRALAQQEAEARQRAAQLERAAQQVKR
jgi:chromosome segregation ATPase